MLSELLYMLAYVGGMPSRVIDTYRKFQEGLETRNTVAGGMGQIFSKKVGIPRGDSLSMMFAALILRAWANIIAGDQVIPYVFVDSMLLLVEGRRMRSYVLLLGALIRHTHNHILDTGA